MLPRRPASPSSSSHNPAFSNVDPAFVVLSKGRGDDDVPTTGGVSKSEDQYRTGRVGSSINFCLSSPRQQQHQEGCRCEGSPFACVSTASSPDSHHQHLCSTSYDVTASSSLSGFPHAIEHRIHSPSSTDALVSPDDDPPPSPPSACSCFTKKGCCSTSPESVSGRGCMTPQFPSPSERIRERAVPVSLASSSPTVEVDKAAEVSSVHSASHCYSSGSSEEPSHITQLPGTCPTLLPQPPHPVVLSQKEKASATVLAKLLQDTLTPRSLRVLVVGCAGRLGRLVFKHLLNIEKHDKRRWLHVTGLARDANTRMQLLKQGRHRFVSCCPAASLCLRGKDEGRGVGTRVGTRYIHL